VNSSAKYLGAPSFAYEVGGFTIDKNGTVTGSDYRVLVGDLESKHGFVPVTAEYDLPIEQKNDAEEVAEATDENDGFVFLEGSAIEMPLEGHTDETIINLEKLISSKAELIKKALGVETLTVEKDEHKLRFPWFKGTLPTPEFTAYAWFISALSPKPTQSPRDRSELNAKRTMGISTLPYSGWEKVSDYAEKKSKLTTQTTEAHPARGCSSLI